MHLSPRSREEVSLQDDLCQMVDFGLSKRFTPGDFATTKAHMGVMIADFMRMKRALTRIEHESDNQNAFMNIECMSL